MPTRWKIKYYKSTSSRYPVKDFVDQLAEIPQARVYNTIELLTEFGVKLRFPHAKKLRNTPIWELRILGESSIRIFYFAQKERVFMLLHAFTKKSQKTPQKELKTAFQRYRNLLSN